MVEVLRQFESYTIKDYLRLVIIIGGYMLLRQIIVRHASNRQLKNQKAEREKELEQARASSSSVDNPASFSWGDKMRDRRRQAFSDSPSSQSIAASESIYQPDSFDAEKDKDIADLLQD